MSCGAKFDSDSAAICWSSGHGPNFAVGASYLEESSQGFKFYSFRMSSFLPCCSGFCRHACRVSEKVTASDVCRMSVPRCANWESWNLQITKPPHMWQNKMTYFCHCGVPSNVNVFSKDAWSPLTPIALVVFLLRFLDSLYLAKVCRRQWDLDCAILHVVDTE